MKLNNKYYSSFKRVIIIMLVVTTMWLIGRTVQMYLLYIMSEGPSFNSTGILHKYFLYTAYDKGIFVLQIISLISVGVMKKGGRQKGILF